MVEETEGGGRAMTAAPPIDTLTFITAEDGTVWWWTPGLDVWSATGGRYLLGEDFRALYGAGTPD